MSGDERSADIDIPSHCPECGSDTIICDYERAEIVCQNPKCAIVLDLSVWKRDALHMLSLTEPGPVPRKFFLDWYRLKAAEKADLAQVRAKYTPDLLRLEHQMTKMPTRLCTRCRKKPAVRDGERGRHPKYCTECRKQVNVEMVRASMKKKPEKYKAIKRRSRKPSPRPNQHALGGKPLKARDMHVLGIKSYSRGSTDDHNEERLSKTDPAD